MKSTILFILIAFSSSLNAQKNKDVSCHWRNDEADIRSRITDFRYSEKGQFYYYFSNDRNNVYVDLRFYDPVMRNVVLRNGVIVWFGAKNKKSKEKGIEYPVPVRLAGRNSEGEMQGREGGAGGRRQGRAPEPDLNMLELLGFSDSGPVRVSDFEANNFRGSIRQEKDGMWYELVMPINKLPEISARNKKGELEFTLGIACRQPPEMGMYNGERMPGEGGGEGMPRGGGRPGGGFGGGRPGGYGGGGMYGGGRGMPGGSFSDASQVIWFRNITLAAEK